MNNSIIQCENLKKYYNNQLVINNINLRISSGEYVAIVGNSGSGKSTLLNILSLLIKGDEGKYLLNGENIFAMSHKNYIAMRNEKIGLILQKFHFISYLTVYENIILPLKLKNKKISSEELERAMHFIEKLDLKDKLKFLPNELSGGQQQRVCIARALVKSPALIFADEPTGNLDTANTEAVMDIFDSLKSKSRTLVMITHNPTLVERFSRKIHIKDGRIVHDSQTPGALT